MWLFLRFNVFYLCNFDGFRLKWAPTSACSRRVSTNLVDELQLPAVCGVLEQSFLWSGGGQETTAETREKAAMPPV